MDENKTDLGMNLAEWLGRRQAYSLVAGTCSAADARCLAEIRRAKLYRGLSMTWDDFCKQRLGMHRSKADEIIRHWTEFGATYFSLHQVTGITAEEYRAIRGSIEDGALRHRDNAIPIAAEHAPRLLEAVRELTPSAPRKRPPAEDPPHPVTQAERALEDLLQLVRGLQRVRVEADEYHRLLAKMGTVSIEMRLVRQYGVPT